MKRTPSDAVIERKAIDAATFIAALEGESADAKARFEERVLAGHSSSQSTGRTHNAPERTYAPHVSAQARAMQFGGADSPAAAYPVLQGAPVGQPESLRARIRETHAAADAARAEGRLTAKQLRAIARNSRR